MKKIEPELTPVQQYQAESKRLVARARRTLFLSTILMFAAIREIDWNAFLAWQKRNNLICIAVAVFAGVMVVWSLLSWFEHSE